MAGETCPVVGVIGAAGNTGRHAVAELLHRGVSVRAVVRRAEQAALYADGVDCRVADLADPASLVEAVRGVDATLYIPPVFSAAEERFGRNVIAALEAADCRRLVYHSVLHAATPDMPHHARKAQVELDVRHSALEWTILQPAMYAQTVLAFLGEDRRTLAPGFSLEKLFAPVALGDIAEASAVVLTEPRHAFATYELAGPALLSFTDFAGLLSRAWDRPVVTAEVPPNEVVAMVAAKLAFDERAAEILRQMLDHYDRHGLVGNANVLRMLIGREPTRIEALFRQMRPSNT